MHGSTPANTRRWPNVDLMLGQRRRRWANINPTLGQRLVFAGTAVAIVSRAEHTPRGKSYIINEAFFWAIIQNYPAQNQLQNHLRFPCGYGGGVFTYIIIK